MATYRVGVLLTASGGSFQRGMRAAGRTTRQTDSALRRASGSATSLGRSTNDAGRRAQSALQRASSSSGGLQSALRRTSNQARETGGAVERAAQRGQRGVRGLIDRFRELGRAIHTSGAGARGGAGGALGGGAITRAAGYLGGGYALSRAAGQELQYETQLTALGTDAGKTDEEMLAVRRHIESIAAREDIRVPVRELVAALDQYYRLAADFDQGVQNLEIFAQGIRRSQSTGKDFATFAAQLRKFGLDGTDALREGVVTAIEAQKAGSFYLQDISAAGGRSMSRWSAVRGQQGRQALADYLALGQVSMAAAGGQREIAATQLQSTVAAFTNEQKLEQIQKLGVYGAAERSPAKVLNELIDAVGGRAEKLSGIFGDEAMGLVSFLLTPEGQRKYRESLAAVSGVGEAQFAAFDAETARMADTSQAKLDTSRDRIQSFFSRFAGGFIQDSITQATAHQNLIMTSALAVLGTRALWRGGRSGLDTWRRWRGRGADDTGADPARGRRGRGGGGLGAPGLVRTMRVTTLIAGRTVGSGIGGRGGGRGRGAAQRAAGGGGFLARAGGRAGGLLQRAGGVLRRVPWLGVALGGAGIAASLSQGDRTGAAAQAGGVAGGIGGAALGGIVGGALGSFVPVLGTSIGAGIGSVLGGWFGSEFGAAETASALERSAGMDAESRDQRRVEARRRWREGEAGGDEEGPREDVDAESRDQRRVEARRRWREGEAGGDEEGPREDGLPPQPREAETASALERSAGMDAESRDQRRVEARRRWREGEAGGDEEGPRGDGLPPPPGRDELRQVARGAFLASRVHNGDIVDERDQSVRIEAPVINVHSETGDPVEIGEAVMEQIDEHIRRRQRHDEERLVDTTFSDPDPTVLF